MQLCFFLLVDYIRWLTRSFGYFPPSELLHFSRIKLRININAVVVEGSLVVENFRGKLHGS